MKVLVTGGTGYIGSHTAVELLNAGHEVVIIDNLYNSQKEVIDKIEQICSKQVKFYLGDVQDKSLLNKIFNKEEIDAVIHFAGLKAVGESVQKPLEYYRNNLGSTLSLLEVMKDHNCKRIVFSSSATVYGKPKKLPIKEDFGELECLSVFGDDYDTKDGTGVRDYIHVVDLAKGHIKAIEWVSKNKKCEEFNLGTGIGYSVLDMIKTTEKISKKKVNYKIGPRREGDIDACYADPTKAKKELGWQAEKNIEDMCRDAYNYVIKSKEV